MLPFLIALSFFQEKPNASLEPLSFLVGDWQAKYSRGDDSVNSVVHSKWRLQGQLLEIEETQTVKSKSSTTILLVSFDPQTKDYRGLVINSAIPSTPITLDGIYADSKLTLRAAEDDSNDGAAYSFTYEKLPDNKYRFSSLIKAGSQEYRETADYSRQA